MKNKYQEIVGEMTSDTINALSEIREFDTELKMALFSEMERRREVNAEQVRLFKKALGR